MKKLDFKKDKYRKSRGGYSRFLEVSCHHCDKKLLYIKKMDQVN